MPRLRVALLFILEGLTRTLLTAARTHARIAVHPCNTRGTASTAATAACVPRTRIGARERTAAREWIGRVVARELEGVS